MKRLLMNIALLVAVCLLVPAAGALMNPAAVYCDAMGYEYSVESSEAGDTGYCTVDGGLRFEGWEFLRGEAGSKHGYCEEQGYSAKTITDPAICAGIYSDSCMVCVLPDGEEVEVTGLMGLSFREPEFIPPEVSAPETTIPPTTEASISLPLVLFGVMAAFILASVRKR